LTELSKELKYYDYLQIRTIIIIIII
jgi:hypothetical protein